ncbi:YdeI/OmpD-associated family protein [Emticicia sp. BO119]|uniref:YdeI/OmpD-associated family protein n=1 Tax=Emticicia sp. BO119 TaxID=2757768 RepID=UPI0015F0236E|nr:YdeI/OmpD-associated family protein [Emticicia sp. BO119]MBA4849680.1 YdeI/OmpD-associated family protein [Emticicia sp. BO119]
MPHTFQAKIYQTGINWAVDVPEEITTQLLKQKGYIKIKGQINGFDFTQTLVPVKNAPYRLFVNFIMMKGGKTAVGEIADFAIEQDTIAEDKRYPMPDLLAIALRENDLETAFESLTASRKKDILKYLFYVKTDETMLKNIAKVIAQLKDKSKDVRVP